MPKLILLSSVGSRAPLAASLLAHAAIVAVAVGGGHGNGQSRTHFEERTIDVDAPLPPLPVAEEAPPAAAVHAHADPPRSYKTHTHPYALPPDHDARPHDPSIDHRQAAVAPAVVVAEDPGLPRFSLVLGTAEIGAGGITVGGGAGAPGTGTQASADGAQPEEPTVSVRARLVSRGEPEYPPAARIAGIEADVPLEIVVDVEGRVVEAKLLRPAGHGFDESALNAIRGYRFTPAQHDGAAARARMRWTVSFRLE